MISLFTDAQIDAGYPRYPLKDGTPPREHVMFSAIASSSRVDTPGATCSVVSPYLPTGDPALRICSISAGSWNRHRLRFRAHALRLCASSGSPIPSLQRGCPRPNKVPERFCLRTVGRKPLRHRLRVVLPLDKAPPHSHASPGGGFHSTWYTRPHS